MKPAETSVYVGTEGDAGNIRRTSLAQFFADNGFAAAERQRIARRLRRYGLAGGGGGAAPGWAVGLKRDDVLAWLMEPPQ